MYTLIHDDLPSMDNDDFRRGRASSHKKYGEANAILAGDALLNLSYQILAHIDHPQLSTLIKCFANQCGANGLILGQFLDLDTSKKTHSEVINIHRLKTSKLIELSLFGSALLSKRSPHNDKLSKLGEYIGLSFQILDDLSELSQKISPHEYEINIFLVSEVSARKSFEILFYKLDSIQKIINELKLHELSNIFSDYKAKMILLIKDNQKTIQENLFPSLRGLITELVSDY